MTAHISIRRDKCLSKFLLTLVKLFLIFGLTSLPSEGSSSVVMLKRSTFSKMSLMVIPVHTPPWTSLSVNPCRGAAVEPPPPEAAGGPLDVSILTPKSIPNQVNTLSQHQHQDPNCATTFCVTFDFIPPFNSLIFSRFLRFSLCFSLHFISKLTKKSAINLRNTSFC